MEGNLQYDQVTTEEIVRVAVAQPERFELQSDQKTGDQLIRLKGWTPQQTNDIAEGGGHL